MICRQKNRNELCREWIVVVIDVDPSGVVSIGVDVGRTASGSVVSSVVRTTDTRTVGVKSVVPPSVLVIYVAWAKEDVADVLPTALLPLMVDVLSEAFEVERIAGDWVLADDAVTRAEDTIGVVGNRVLIMWVVALVVDWRGVVSGTVLPANVVGLAVDLK